MVSSNYVMNPGGGNPVNITRREGPDTSPVWVPVVAGLQR